MALVLADRVLETTAVAGTGNAALAGAQTNYQPFSVIGDGSTTYYTIVDNNNNEWEVGIGTYVATGNYISRDTVLSSSNGGALVYFPSGTKDIFLDLPSEEVLLSAGDVTGPASAVANNFAAFNMTTGKLIKDSGYNASSFATAAQGTLADTAIQPGDLGTAAYLDAGSANGVATLDAGGKVPTSQIPQMGDLNYQGTWNASTNTPTLTSSAGTKGFYYVVSVAGSTNLNGITDWKVGDWAVFNGSVWEKIDNTDAVTSVNGYTGTVVLTASDVGAQPAGTYVTSVGATSPVTSSGGTTPTIGMPAATTSVSGYLTSADWTTFNGKQDAFGSQTANYVYAAPNGSAGAPTFRALVGADIPSLSSTYIPYTGASSAINLNAQTVVNVDHLGIGTTSVPTILVRAIGDNNSSSRIAVRGYSSNANSSSMRVTKFRGTAGAPQAPQSGDSLGKFELAGYGTTSSDGYPQASFEGVATQSWGAIARGAKTLIKVTPNNTITQVTAVTVDQDSKVTLAGALDVTGTTTLATSLSGLAKLTSGVVSAATSGTDYAPATSGTSILYGNGSGGFSNVTIGTGVSFAGGTLSATGSGGTVTSVTGTAPVVSSGGATPAISMAAATTSVNGYLTSTDWNTFNGKQAALTSGTNIKTVSGVSLLGSGDVGTIGTGYGGTGLTSFTNKGVVYASSTSALTTGTGLQFDGTNLGLGVTPVAWSASYKAIQINTIGSIAADTSSTLFGNNIYWNGSANIYLTTGTAASYLQSSGIHSWSSAVSGTAGNTATLNTLMTLNASGNLGLNVTPSAWSSSFRAYELTGGALYSGSSSAILVAQNFYFDGTNNIYKTTNPSTAYSQNAGVHSWLTAASGTAGNPITFSTSMTLTASGNLQFNSGYGSAATAYGCRAWVNFNGTGTVAIRGSGNVSSITDNGTGDYTINFTTAMPDVNYSVSGTASWDGSTFNNSHGMSLAVKNNNTGAMSTGSVNIITYYEGNGSRYDPLFTCASVFR